ncbi:uncharacterized protein LOC120668067 [Panicum virgatum]|uniref:uncharacterized protein LOC120668067 n=1 Tax=Panicum virgatum TaxID=38727 RepID=UPI0019D52705|nr:uncharacterized protein LOC120668067 [Panicum virgatum]
MTKLSVAAHSGGGLPASVRHAFHEPHSMKLVPGDDGVQFRCDACKQPGSGASARYECGRGGGVASCNLDLHTGCALAPDAREIGGFRFLLRCEPEVPRSCDACGVGARGLAYHCPELDHDVGPPLLRRPAGELEAGRPLLRAVH